MEASNKKQLEKIAEDVAKLCENESYTFGEGMPMDDYVGYLHKIFDAYLNDCGIHDVEWEITMTESEENPGTYNIDLVTDDPRVALAFNVIRSSLTEQN